MSRDDLTRAPLGVAPDEALDAVDDALRRLPPRPAPTATVQRTLERVAQVRARRAPSRPFGWVLVAAASLVAVVGAWLSVRSTGVRAPSDGDNVARVDASRPSDDASRYTYRLRGQGEVKELEASERTTEETPEEDRWSRGSFDMTVADGKAVPGATDTETETGADTTKIGGEGYRGKDAMLRLIDGRDVPPPVSATDKVGKLEALSDRLTAQGQDDSGVRRPAPVNGLVVVADADQYGEAEKVQPDAGETGREQLLTLTTAPTSGEVRLDGHGWSTVTVTGTDARADSGGDAEEIVDLPVAAPAAPDPTPRVVEKRSVAGDGQLEPIGGQDVADASEKAIVPPSGATTTTFAVDGGRYTVKLDHTGAAGAPVETRGRGEEANAPDLPALKVANAEGEPHTGADDDATRDADGEGDDRTPPEVAANQRGDLFWSVDSEATGKKETKKVPPQDAAAPTFHAGLFDAENADDQPTQRHEDLAQVTLGQGSRAEPARPRAADPGRAAAGSASPGPSSERGEARSDRGVLGGKGKRAVPPRTLVPPAAAVEGLTMLPTQGYYRNTYLPGDAETTWLRASLTDRLTRDGVDLALERAAIPPVQPFAAPGDQGIGLSVTADRAAVAGPTRMTVQIGLAGADRAASRRAPLNLALVLDVAGVSSEAERQALWSLADTLATSRQPGDRFAVVVTGAASGDALLPVGAASGPEVRRALAAVYETRVATAPGDTDLDGALAQAIAAVRAGARDGAPLGADVVVVASPRPVASAARVSLEERARQAALAGVHVSAVGVGGRADADALRGLAEAGQGRRLLAGDSEAARAVMARELAASGRAVARAVRLRIRLGDGVKLVGVLGSEPLDTADAERVRVAERAIDRQVREATGIASDRGDDEDGIQIVIPAFYAGDRHVILLDLVAPGPGQLVDVRARFKDLVALDNGEASASLTLGAHPGEVVASPAARNVVANRAAYSVGQALLDASRALDRGDRGAAFEALAGARAGLAELQASDPALAVPLSADRGMLDQYVALLGDAPAWGGDPTLVAWVSRSLRLAARIKGLP